MESTKMALLPPNHPKKELANKETIFSCNIKYVRAQTKNKLDDEQSSLAD